MSTAEQLSENSSQGFAAQNPPCIGPETDLSRNLRWGCGHVYDETPVGLVVYVRNDPINLVDPDGRRLRRVMYLPEWGVVWTTYNLGEFGSVRLPGFGITGWREIWYYDERPNPFQNKIDKAKKEGGKKIANADRDCLELLATIGVTGVYLSNLSTLLNSEGGSFQNGEAFPDRVWDVMGGEVMRGAGMESTTTVADIFRMGLPPWPSIDLVDGLSARNGTIYLRPSAITWENIVHEEIHQLGGGFQSDKDILDILWHVYPNEIDPKGSSSQISKIIKDKCK